MNAIEDDQDIGLQEDDAALHQFNRQICLLVSIGRIAYGNHPIPARAVVLQFGVCLGSVGAFLAIMILMALAIDEDRGVCGGETKMPLGIRGHVARLEMIIEQAFTIGGEYETVAIGMFVIFRFTTAER